MAQLNIVILAAGKGKRMLSARPKVLHEIMGKPMLECVVEEAKKLSPSKIVVVTGHEKGLVEEHLRSAGVVFALQEEQKGTAHALLTAEPMIGDGDVLVLYGDVPLISAATLRAFLAFFETSEGVAFMTTEVNNPDGYGRVIMEGNEIREIVEDADADQAQKKIREINTGICMLRRGMLSLAKEIKAENAKGEYYLTDICKVAGTRGIRVKGYHYGDAQEVLGINTRKELLEANRIMRERILDRHLQQGVTLAGDGIYIEQDVQIGRDTVIFPFSYLRGTTTIGEGALIGPHAVIKDSRLGDNVTVEPFCSLDGVTAEPNVKIGPFSRIRPTTVLKEGVKIGSFVEVKNSVTLDVPDGALAVTRVKQKHIEGYARRKK